MEKAIKEIADVVNEKKDIPHFQETNIFRILKLNHPGFIGGRFI